jgi:hypothetical protein
MSVSFGQMSESEKELIKIADEWAWRFKKLTLLLSTRLSLMIT